MMSVSYESLGVLTDVEHHIHVSAGELRPNIPLPDAVSLEKRESSLEGESKERFLIMMRRMLQWEPSKRSLANELAGDE